MVTVVKVDGIAWFDRMRAGVDQFGRDTGHDVRMIGPSQADAAAQVQLIDNLISQGVDAICVVPFSSRPASRCCAAPASAASSSSRMRRAT
jgi:simple sugar transport system substrate-binding protein